MIPVIPELQFQEGASIVADAKKVKVLAVDDSNFMLTMISAYLEGSRFELVATAKNGKEAVEQYKQHKPDLVLLDIVMPEETGIEALEKLLAVDPSARAVMVSSLGTEQAVMDCLKKGAKNFLQKPFEQDGLIALLEKVSKETGAS